MKLTKESLESSKFLRSYHELIRFIIESPVRCSLPDCSSNVYYLWDKQKIYRSVNACGGCVWLRPLRVVFGGM